MKKFWAQTKGNTGEVHIYGDIGDGLFGDGVSAKWVADTLKDLKKNGSDELAIYINSGGGSVFDGMAIYNSIKRWEGKVTVYVDGLAASAASLVAMAGHRVNMSEAGIMMIHEPSGVAMGTRKQMEDVRNRLEKIRESMVSVYALRTKKKPEEIEKLMEAETWMTAAEAVEQGFADNMYEGSEEAKVLTQIAASVVPYVAHYHNIPQNIRAAISQPPHEEKKMEFTLLLRALGLPADASEAQAIKVLDDLRAGTNTAEARHKSILAELEDLVALTGEDSPSQAKGVFLAWKQSQEKVTQLIAEKELADAAARSKEVDVTVDNAVRDGKIPPSMKEFWKAQGNKSLEMLKAYVEKAPKLVAGPVPGAQPGAIQEPPPADPTATIAVDEAEQERIFKSAGITDPKMKEELRKKVKEQNALLAKHGIKIPNSVIPA